MKKHFERAVTNWIILIGRIQCAKLLHMKWNPLICCLFLSLCCPLICFQSEIQCKRTALHLVSHSYLAVLFFSSYISKCHVNTDIFVLFPYLLYKLAVINSFLFLSLTACTHEPNLMQATYMFTCFYTFLLFLCDCVMNVKCSYNVLSFE